jgi:Methane oxygenase PmoA
MNPARLLPAFAALIMLPTLRAAESGFTLEKASGGGVTVKVNGQIFADYVIDQANKPYLAPVFGPTGKQMTRNYPMKKVEGEQHDHPHHRGICFGHESIGGFDSWAETATFEEMKANPKNAAKAQERLDALGSCKHREFTELKADADKAVIVELCDYLDASGKKLCGEVRRMTFRVVDGARVIDFDQDLTTSEGSAVFGDKKDAGLSIRVPTSMAVDSKQGGKIINSDGITDKDAWSKPAKWVDFHGPVEGEHLGVAMLNHPTSFRYPTRWHVRTYGLFTANPFASQQFDKALPDGAFELKSGEHLKLRHRFIFHKGDEKAGKIADAWEAYAKEK